MFTDEVHGVRALRALMAAITRAKGLASVYDAALDALEHGLGVHRASILQFDPDGVMRFKAWRGVSDEYRRAVEGHTPWRPDTPDAEILVVPDVRDDAGLQPFQHILRSEGISSLAIVPLKRTGGVIGKFMLYFEEPRFLTEPERTLAEVIAAQVAFAVQHLEAEKEANDREAELRLVTDVAPAYIAHCDRELPLRVREPSVRASVPADARRGDRPHRLGLAGQRCLRTGAAVHRTSAAGRTRRAGPRAAVPGRRRPHHAWGTGARSRRAGAGGRIRHRPLRRHRAPPGRRRQGRLVPPAGGFTAADSLDGPRGRAHRLLQRAVVSVHRLSTRRDRRPELGGHRASRRRAARARPLARGGAYGHRRTKSSTASSIGRRTRIGGNWAARCRCSMPTAAWHAGLAPAPTSTIRSARSRRRGSWPRPAAPCPRWWTIRRRSKAVATLAVPDFADWCAVDVVEDDGTLRRLSASHPVDLYGPAASAAKRPARADNRDHRCDAGRERPRPGTPAAPARRRAEVEHHRAAEGRHRGGGCPDLRDVQLGPALPGRRSRARRGAGLSRRHCHRKRASLQRRPRVRSAEGRVPGRPGARAAQSAGADPECAAADSHGRPTIRIAGRRPARSWTARCCTWCAWSTICWTSRASRAARSSCGRSAAGPGGRRPSRRRDQPPDDRGRRAQPVRIATERTDLCRGGRDASGAGLLQPAEQRREVHAGRRHHLDQRRAGGVRRRGARARQRRWASPPICCGGSSRCSRRWIGPWRRPMADWASA